MNREEAKQWLSGFHKGDPDDEPKITAALTLLEKDEKLQEWWNREQEFDSWVSQKLDESYAPSALRYRILNQNQNTSRIPGFALRVLAVAATLFLFVGLVMIFRPGPRVTYAEVMQAGLGIVSQKDFQPDHITPDMSNIRQWIQARGGTSAFQVLTGLKKGEPIGCKIIQVRGVMVSIVCFHSPDHKGALHLIIFDRTKLLGTPPIGASITQKGKWTSAFWADNQYSYILVTDLGMNAIQSALKNS